MSEAWPKPIDVAASFAASACGAVESVCCMITSTPCSISAGGVGLLGGVEPGVDPDHHHLDIRVDLLGVQEGRVDARITSGIGKEAM
jgi:hypothetical protein